MPRFAGVFLAVNAVAILLHSSCCGFDVLSGAGVCDDKSGDALSVTSVLCDRVVDYHFC